MGVRGKDAAEVPTGVHDRRRHFLMCIVGLFVTPRLMLASVHNFVGLRRGIDVLMERCYQQLISVTYLNIY